MPPNALICPASSSNQFWFGLFPVNKFKCQIFMVIIYYTLQYSLFSGKIGTSQYHKFHFIAPVIVVLPEVSLHINVLCYLQPMLNMILSFRACLI